MPKQGEIFQIKVGDKFIEAKWIGELKKLDGTVLWGFQNGDLYLIPANKFPAYKGKTQAPLVASLKG